MTHHSVKVWLNGKRVGEHEGGHLPFHLPLDAAGLIEWGKANRLTIAINNTLTTTSIPPGFVQQNIAGRRVQRLQMDFFHYAGLHRQVRSNGGRRRRRRRQPLRRPSFFLATRAADARTWSS